MFNWLFEVVNKTLKDASIYLGMVELGQHLSEYVQITSLYWCHAMLVYTCIYQLLEMATHFSILASRILWTEEPGGLLSIGSHRVGHD